MGKTKNRASVTDDYLALVRKCPLRVIRTEGEYQTAVEVYADLISRADSPGLSTGESDYADVLSRLIRDYDDKHATLPKVRLSPIDALKHLMSAHGMNTTDLGKLLGSGRGQASLILNGRRELSKANIRVLADRFKVSVALLF